jgi:hypothetical protein
MRIPVYWNRKLGVFIYSYYYLSENTDWLQFATLSRIYGKTIHYVKKRCGLCHKKMCASRNLLYHLPSSSYH